MRDRNLLVAPHKILRTPARRLEFEKDAQLIRELVHDMERLLSWKRGLGLAACQVGEPVDLFIISRTKFAEARKCWCFINTEAFQEGKTISKPEGCLSLPNKRFVVKRHHQVNVTTHTISGKRKHKVFRGLTARCIQHEMDHLKGILISSKGEPA